MSRVYIAAGSNLGEREMTLEQAFRLLARPAGLQPRGAAPLYETVPVGGAPQGNFLNTVWEFETGLPPADLLQVLLTCEKRLGRVRSEKNAERTIDLDLAAYEDRVLSEKGLTLPHPRLQERWFVLKPLCDLAPHWVHPVSGKKAVELLADLERDQTDLPGWLYSTSRPQGAALWK